MSVALPDSQPKIHNQKAVPVRYVREASTSKYKLTIVARGNTAIPRSFLASFDLK